ncbi:MAG: transporter substrate-binding domain-containing protein [Butyricicoccus sp.]|nr:transporter substrate-binding domain-containing protein [Butyricicoccus sp.]
MKKKFALVLAALMMAGTLAACGGNNNQSAAGSSAAGNSASSATDSATPTVDAIKEKGEITMLTNAQFPPFEYLADDGSVQGVDPDLAQAVADKLGVKLKIVDMDFDGIISALKSGKGDFAAAGMTITEERLKEVDFTDEYVTSSQMVIVRSDSDLSGDKDALDAALSGKNIAVQQGTTGDWYASGDESTGSTIKNANVLQFKSAVEAGMNLANGKADAVIIDQKPAEAIVASQDGKLKLLDTKLTDEQYAFAVQKGQEDLLAVINEVLAEYKGDKVDELINQHMGI